MREAFTAELDAISDDLVHLTRLVGSAMNRATQSLLDADLRLAEEVIAADEQVDVITAETEEKCFDVIALQAPVASDLRIVGQKRVRWTKADAEAFYAVHKERPFFGELVEQMIASPVVVQVLEGENAILKNREIMGATNPANAAEGTIRKEFALSVGENSVHGSDAPETAAQEIKFFFSDDEIVG